MRYRLEPGTKLTYVADVTGDGTLPLEGKTTHTVWVVRRNDDGTVRVIVRSQKSLTVRGEKHPDREEWAWCDIGSDGAYEDNATTLLGAKVSAVLPLLPGPGEKPRVRGDERCTYRREEPWLVIDVASAWDKIYEITRELRVKVEDGLPSFVRLKAKQTRGFKTTHTEVAKRTGREKVDPDRMKKFATEVAAYFAAVSRYEETIDKAVLDAALAKTTAEPLREQLRKMLARHPNRAKYEEEERQRRAQYLGKPAAEWETTDFQGKTHSLKSHRGKVLLLDFWYRNCGWCTRAMPQLKAVASHFEGKPVVVLGMNTDRKESDARFVIETMELNYANLRAREVPNQYGVRGYPTLVVVDQKGIVREFHVGYAPDLKEKLIKAVEALRADK
jgi:thiol-disulfide isomerase/thioredoxin